MATVNAMIAAAVARPPEQRGQDRGDPADEVIREIDGNAKDGVAKEQGHDGAPSSGPESDDSWRRPPGRPAPPGAGRRWGLRSGQADDDQAAAGTAVGARGRARPAASGSRWGRNPARQDFSRRAQARRPCGIAVTAAATRALCASSATSMPVRVMAASTSSPDGADPGRASPGKGQAEQGAGQDRDHG